MFYVNTQFDRIHIIATSTEGGIYNTTITNAYTGETKNLTITSLTLSYILQINLNNYGEPEGFEKMYIELDPLFKGWPNTLRPIP